jgi:hypothetical protein
MPKTMAEEGCSSIDLSGLRVDPSPQIMGCSKAYVVSDESFAACLHRELVWHQNAGAGTDDVRGTCHSRKRMDPRPIAASPFICHASVSDDG